MKIFSFCFLGMTLSVFSSDYILPPTVTLYCTQYCPLDVGSRTKRSNAMGCASGNYYHCYVLENRTLVEGCHPVFYFSGTSGIIVLLQIDDKIDTIEFPHTSKKDPAEEVLEVPGCYGKTNFMGNKTSTVTSKTSENYTSTLYPIEPNLSRTNSKRFYTELVTGNNFVFTSETYKVNLTVGFRVRSGSILPRKNILLFAVTVVAIVSIVIAVILIRKCRERNLRKQTYGPSDQPLNTTENPPAIETELNVYNEVRDVLLAQNEATCINEDFKSAQQNTKMQGICKPIEHKPKSETVFKISLSTESLMEENIYHEIDDLKTKYQSAASPGHERCIMVETEWRLNNVISANALEYKEKLLAGSVSTFDYMEPVDSRLLRDTRRHNDASAIDANDMILQPTCNSMAITNQNQRFQDAQISDVIEFENRVYHTLGDSRVPQGEHSKLGRTGEETILSGNIDFFKDENDIKIKRDSSEDTAPFPELREISRVKEVSLHKNETEIAHCSGKIEQYQKSLRSGSEGHSYYKLEVKSFAVPNLKTAGIEEITQDVDQTGNDSLVSCNLTEHGQNSSIIDLDEQQIYHEIEIYEP